MSKVLYAGSFDPITYGHMDIIEQASILFDEVIITVMQNSSKKNSLFTLEERYAMIQNLYSESKKIKVSIGEGATADLAKLYKCSALIRGLRTVTDFETELQLAKINKDITNGEINTVCLFATNEHQFTSSSVVKKLVFLGKDISKYVDISVEEKVLEKVKSR